MSSMALRSSFLQSALRPLSTLALALLLSVPLLGDSHVRIVRLSFVDGTVEIDKGDGRGFSTAYLNMPVVHGSKVWARDGQAEVEMEDGSSIRLTPDTIVAFNDLSLNNNGDRSSSVQLQQGTAYFDIRHRDSDHFELQFGRSQLTLNKSARFRVDADKHDFEVGVLSGEIQVANASATEITVKKGETIRLDSDDPDRYYLAKGVDAENYDDWDNDRAKWHDQAVSTASTFNSNGVTYGLTDLSMYGNYFYVPGYGYMWRPASAGLGWDPFADGYWVSYPGFGYTFVSGYPWGWAPYRYGSWQFVNGYGWCWAPGSNWNHWQPVPPVRNIPPGYRPPRVPHHGPAVLMVNNGTPVPAPNQGGIIDNDALQHRLPHARKITDQAGVVVRQGPAAATSPAQGFVASPPNSANVPANVPAAAVMPTPRHAEPPVAGRWHREDGDTSGAGGSIQNSRPAAAGMTVAPATVSHPATQSVAPTSPTQAPAVRVTQPTRIEPRSAPAMSPRMESHAPPARMDRPMSSAPAAMPRSMPSGGGPHMSAPSMAGGGMHAGGGGGGGGSPHGSHR